MTVTKDLRVGERIARYPYQRIHEVAKIWSSEIWGCGLVFRPAAFSQDPELHYLLTAAKLPSTFMSPMSHALFVSRKSRRALLLVFFCQKVVIAALQESSGLLMLCCVGHPADAEVGEVPYEDWGLQT